MKVVPLLNALLCFCLAGPARADRVATVAGTDAGIACRVDQQVLLLDVDQAARAFGWRAKTPTPGRLLVLCRDGRQAHCVPLRLEEIRSATHGKATFVDADVLGGVLGFRVERVGKQIILQPSQKRATADVDVPAYNADWGEGRGFRVGQTLPDIPLYDTSGEEVRFSKFLGRQYIIYCWASW